MLFASAAPALASGTPSQDAYSGTGSNQISRAQGTATLPFTGLNVGLLAVVAVVLVGTGLVLRARTRADS